MSQQQTPKAAPKATTKAAPKAAPKQEQQTSKAAPKAAPKQTQTQQKPKAVAKAAPKQVQQTQPQNNTKAANLKTAQEVKLGVQLTREIRLEPKNTTTTTPTPTPTSTPVQTTTTTSKQTTPKQTAPKKDKKNAKQAAKKAAQTTTVTEVPSTNTNTSTTTTTPVAPTPTPSKNQNNNNNNNNQNQNQNNNNNNNNNRRQVIEGKAIVKAVLSGDSVVLLIKEGQTVVEKKLTFSSITAPRLNKEDGVDEPFAWESREFVRNLVIGKEVDYVIENQAGIDKRINYYGHIKLSNGTNVSESLLSNGLATVNIPKNSTNLVGKSKDLAELSIKARNAKVGMFTENQNAIQQSVRKISFNTEGLYERHANKQITVSIDKVITGSQFRVWLCEDKNQSVTWYPITIRLAGAQCPQFKKGENPEEFAVEARDYVEARALHRNASLTLRSADKKADIFFATVVVNGQNLAQELLKAGLARYVLWSGKDEVDILTRAENIARTNRLRIFKTDASSTNKNNHANVVVESSLTSPDLQEGQVFTAKIREITSIGQIGISFRVGNSNVEKKVNLASIKVRRLSSLLKDKNTQKEYVGAEPFAFETREFIRTNLIGKIVTVYVESVRLFNNQRSNNNNNNNNEQQPQKNQNQNQNQNQSRVQVSIEYDKSKSNLALKLIEFGYAEIVEHRNPNEKRAFNYDNLILAYRRAQTQKVGIHGKPEDFPKFNVQDLTSRPDSQSRDKDIAKAKQFYGYFESSPSTNAVVEYVQGATRFKLYVPRQNCILTFLLSNVQSVNREDKKLSNDALEFVREKIYQRDVLIEVESQDRVGNFIGKLFINNKNIAISLLEEGFVALQTNYRSSPNLELRNAEEKAKKSRKRIWKNYDPIVEAEKTRKLQQTSKEEREEKSKSELFNVRVTEIVEGNRFYCQILNQDNSPYNHIAKELQILGRSNVNASFTPDVGQLVAALFIDKNWYRAKILFSNPETKKYIVRYIDYGNVSEVTFNNVRLLSNELATPQPQAEECVLAFVVTPSLKDEFGNEAALLLRDLVYNKELVAENLYRDENGRPCLTLADIQNQLSINAILVQEGLAKVENTRNRLFSRLLTALKDEEQRARRSHINIWQYGDDDDDEDFLRK
eukprot:TRINITY_DN239_c0_g1_i10.p1 TRINITY_DN239_c0_g1~~TRINITY_DN239_c0_g1_i10.p1  ORF type:complete len:1127 (+),score=704.21 TRINITY_DN239_c0_g1_i10:151-3531(+)